jgi:plastocyanin
MPAIAENFVVGVGDDCASGTDCFFPDSLTIHVGDSVTFYIFCEGFSFVCHPHNVVADDGSFRCAQGCDGEGGNGNPASPWPGWSFTRTFTRPGVVKYHDEQDGLAGVIVVLSAPGTMVVEFHNTDLDHYFITADPVEQSYVDSGAAGRWQRTGGAFKAGGPAQVCRFAGSLDFNPDTLAPWGPNSHFYTADAYECEFVKASFRPWAKSWRFEGTDFTIHPVGGDGCAADQVPIYRAYNNGYARGIDSNHRITADRTAYEATVARGWIGEGIVMCAPQ